MKQIGLRAHDLGKFSSISALASEVAKFGSDLPIQLALKKVIHNAPDASEYTEAYISSVCEDLSSKHVHVGVFGCYINPVHPDESIRTMQLTQFEQHLKYARLLNCPLVGTETGSLQPNCSYHPDTASKKVLDTFYRSLERLLKAAVKYDAIVGIEAVSKQHTISTISRMAAVVEKFNTPHLKVIYDPTNLVSWTGISEADGSVRGVPSFEAQKTFFCEALDAFGSHIAAVHVKDYKLDEQGFKIGDIPVGTGVLDWEYLFKELSNRNIEVPALLENLDPNTLSETLQMLHTF